MSKYGNSKLDLDWNDLMKVMQTPSRNNSRCNVVASSHDSLDNYKGHDNNTNKDNRTGNRELQKRNKEKKADDVCVAKLRRIFASCCADSSLTNRVNDLEYKVKRLEKVYCKKVKKQLDELNERKPGTVHSVEFVNRDIASERDNLRRQSSGSQRRSTDSRRRQSGFERKSRSSFKKVDDLIRSVPHGVSRVVFKKNSESPTSDDPFSDDSSTHGRKENYFFITSAPSYFDRDQIPVKDVADNEETKKSRNLKSSFDDELRKSSRNLLKNSLVNEESRKSNRNLKTTFDIEDFENPSSSINKSFDNEEFWKSNRNLKTSFDNEEFWKSNRNLKTSLVNEESRKSNRNLKTTFDFEDFENPSSSLNKSFVEYTSILKQTKDIINPVAANIATFNKSSKVSSQQPTVSDAAGQMAEEFFNILNENETKEETEDDFKIKSLSSDKAVEAIVAVERINRSVSTCKLPIDINLYLLSKDPKLDLHIERQNCEFSNFSNYNKLHSHSHLGVTRAVCFDTPSSSSSSLVSIRFARVTQRHFPFS